MSSNTSIYIWESKKIPRKKVDLWICIHIWWWNLYCLIYYLIEETCPIWMTPQKNAYKIIIIKCIIHTLHPYALHIRVGVKYSWPSTQVHQVPQIYTKYKYWSSTHFLKKVLKYIKYFHIKYKYKYKYSY